MENTFTKFMKEQGNNAFTENDANVYRTTFKPLLDCNFLVSSWRKTDSEEIFNSWIAAFNSDRISALRWLFYLRNCRGGIGERESFRKIMIKFSKKYPEIAIKLLHIIPEYGRWDDLIEIAVSEELNSEGYSEVSSEAFRIIYTQLLKDQIDMDRNVGISLLVKWMPSCNASSKTTRAKGLIFANMFFKSEREYRKTLSKLRKYIDITESKMCANEWGDIDYNKVPSKAGLRYNSSFLNHDKERFTQHIKDTINGDSKFNVGTLVPYEILYKMEKETNDGNEAKILYYDTIWDLLLKEGYKNDLGIDDALVVVDGSDSMDWVPIDDKTHVKPIHVARSLGIYFSSLLKGPLKDKCIEFSKYPSFIDLSNHEGLYQKYNHIKKYNDCSTTNIEAVFNLLLSFALYNKMNIDDMPKQILIISDMHFDSIMSEAEFNEKLFTTIRKRFTDHGFNLPKLIFWNVSSGKTIPEISNSEGLALISGFSQSAIKVANTDNKDPLDALMEVIYSHEYDLVEQCLNKE